MTKLESVHRKEAALRSLGELLPSYAALQSHYNAQVHMPDYRKFSSAWDESLYQPIRQVVEDILAHQARSLGKSTLLYCGTGAHAPLFQGAMRDRLDSTLSKVTLLDIDDEALTKAREVLREKLGGRIESFVCDLTGPYGQRLCDLYSAAIRSATTVTGVRANLKDGLMRVGSIFTNGEPCASLVCLSSDSPQDNHTCIVSEMVASFTGTAVWLAFRTRLYELFGGMSSESELTDCLAAATAIWQSYNSHFVAQHAEDLRRKLAPGGVAVLVFDTCKIYDEAGLESLSSFPSALDLSSLLVREAGSVERAKSLEWRDHVETFAVSLYGLPISDFRAHSHRVEVFLLRNTGDSGD